MPRGRYGGDELQRELGSVSYENGARLEDPVLYCGLEIVLGIVSREGEGVPRIQLHEWQLLDETGIPYRMKIEWVG